MNGVIRPGVPHYKGSLVLKDTNPPAVAMRLLERVCHDVLLEEGRHFWVQAFFNRQRRDVEAEYVGWGREDKAGRPIREERIQGQIAGDHRLIKLALP